MSQVKTISFKGRPYVTVAERVRLVHEQKHDFEVVDSTFQEVAGRVLCKVTILVDGKRYTGSAEAKINNAVPKSADDTNPLECGETSALGRALAFAGLGTVDGIASYDEIARGVPTSELEALQEPAQPSKLVERRNPAPDKKPLSALESAAEKAKQRALQSGVIANDAEWEGLVDQCGLKGFNSGADIARINGKITELEKNRKSA